MTKKRGPILWLKSRSRRFWWWTVAVAIPWFYAGAYFQLLERKVYRQTGVEPTTGQNLFDTEPQYRIAERWVEVGLRPAYWADRRVRREYWATIEKPDGRKWKNPEPPAGVR